MLVALGMLRDPTCGTDTPAGGPNAACERTTDCRAGLSCGLKGFCAPPEAGDGGVDGDSGPSDARDSS